MRTAALSLMTTMAIMLVVSANATAQIPWQDNLRSAHTQAQREGKLILLHFYSDNCTWCDRLEEGSFKAPQVGQAIDHSFVPVKIHANSAPKLAEMFKVSKFPTDVIVTTDGKTLSHGVSPQEPDRYVAMLTKTLPMLAALNNAAPNNVVAKQVAAPSSPAVAATFPVTSPVAPAQSVPVTQSAPSYAAADSPTATSLATPEFGLPAQTPVDNGVKAKLAASRSEGFSLEMPAQSAADQTENAIETETAITEDVTLDASSGFAATEPASPSNTSLKVEQAELAMQGFCPVTVISQDKWVEGKPEFGVVHLGKLYLFTSEDNMKTFLADPIPFTPVLNEIDVVRFFEERKIVPGKREWGLKDPVYNRMFFFADEAAMNHFYNEYERYTDAAIEVMEKAVKDANPGT
jgi:protein disulfide-isomerase